MNISLPDAMKTFIDEQVARGGYGSSSEYIRDLVRAQQTGTGNESGSTTGKTNRGASQGKRLVAHLRGRGNIPLSTDEIMALTRND